MEKFSMKDELQSEKKDESSNIDQIETKKLTPEIKEMIMEKVTDIFAEGNAHHSTFAINRLYDSGNFYNIKNLLSPDGEFIGRRKDYFDSKVELNSDNIRDYFSLETPFVNDIKNQFLYGIQSNIASNIRVAKNAEDYRKKIKDTPAVSFNERRNTHVFFNLIGRNTTSFTQPDDWFHGVSFIFDPPKKEVLQFDHDSGTNTYVHRFPKFGEYVSADVAIYDYLFLKHRKFPDLSLRLGDDKIIQWVNEDLQENRHIRFNDKGETTPSPKEGFMLPLRIPPRKFKGVVLDWTGEMATNGNFSVFLNDILEEGESYHNLSEDELYVRFIEFYKKLKNNNQASIHLHVSNLRRLFINSMLEACKENPENIIPVYDLDGNLVWPEEIPYDQIVVSVKE